MYGIIYCVTVLWEEVPKIGKQRLYFSINKNGALKPEQLINYIKQKGILPGTNPDPYGGPCNMQGS